MKITMTAIKIRQARTLLMGWVVQSRAAKNFLDTNAARVPRAERPEWVLQVMENAACGLVYQVFRQDDLRYLVERLAYIGAFRRQQSRRRPEVTSEG